MTSKAVFDLLAAAKIAVITDSAALDKVSKDLSQKIIDGDKEIQEYLFSEMLHIEDNRNSTRINTFLTRIRETGARVSAMRSFIEAYFCLKANPAMSSQATKEQKAAAKACFENNGYYPYYVMRDKRNATVFNQKVKDAIAKPWWKHRPEKDDPAYNLTAKIESAVAAMWRAALRAGPEDNIDADFLKDLTDVCVSHGIPVGKLIATVKPDELTKNASVLSARTAIQSANSNLPEDKKTPEASAPAPTENKGEKIVKAEVEPRKGRGKKAA